jgi:hypothetical protein
MLISTTAVPCVAVAGVRNPPGNARNDDRGLLRALNVHWHDHRSESVLAAVIADIVAAMLFALVQSVLLTPLILGGETY